jgi:hypothetical protein
MPSKSTNRNRLRTAQETQSKWAGIFYRAFQRQAPFSAEERAALRIVFVMGNICVIMPKTRSWSKDSALYAVNTFDVEVIVLNEMRIVVSIHLDKAGPNHEIHIITTIHNQYWYYEPSSSIKKKEVIERQVAEWAWAVLRRETAPRRMARIKEELMAAAWAPARVERWLAAGLDVEAL